MKFYSYSPVFPIDSVWNIKQTIIKDYHIQSCKWMASDRLIASPHKITNMGNVKKFIYSLL